MKKLLIDLLSQAYSNAFTAFGLISIDEDAGGSSPIKKITNGEVTCITDHIKFNGSENYKKYTQIELSSNEESLLIEIKITFPVECKAEEEEVYKIVNHVNKTTAGNHVVYYDSERNSLQIYSSISFDGSPHYFHEDESADDYEYQNCLNVLHGCLATAAAWLERITLLENPNMSANNILNMSK